MIWYFHFCSLLTSLSTFATLQLFANVETNLSDLISAQPIMKLIAKPNTKHTKLNKTSQNAEWNWWENARMLQVSAVKHISSFPKSEHRRYFVQDLNASIKSWDYIKLYSNQPNYSKFCSHYIDVYKAQTFISS